MTASQLSAADERALVGLRLAVDVLLGSDGRSGAQLIEVLRRVEVEHRRLASVGHGLINALETAGIARERCLPDTASLLVRELRISPGDAKARVRAAADLGPRVGRDGEVLPPLFGSVAAAQSAGSISVEHAAVIRRTYDGLADEVQAAQGERVQEQLVAGAVRMEPAEFGKYATVVAASLSPGAGLTDAEIDRRRDTALAQRRDGMFLLQGVLTPECGMALRPVFDSLAAPRPAADGTPDPRTPGQRMHDALFDLALMVMRTEQLPASNGVVATILVTATADQIDSGQGYATDSHGDLIPVRRVLDLAIDSQIMPVLFDPTGGVMSYGRLKRMAPPAMRLALIARDGGCSFPDCDRPPQWTQAHHVLEWERDTGPTDIDNMTLVCGYHHRNFAGAGWRSIMSNGVPHWIPPARIDPDQTPRRNTRHHLARVAAA